MVTYAQDPLTPVERWLAEMLAKGISSSTTRPARRREGRLFRELKPDDVAAITGPNVCPT